MVIAAKCAIPAHWRKPLAPGLKEWIRRIDQTSDLEEVIRISQDRYSKYIKIWNSWVHFKTALGYLEMCLPLLPTPEFPYTPALELQKPTYFCGGLDRGVLL